MTTTPSSSYSSDDSTVTINLTVLQSYLERHDVLEKPKKSIFGAYWSSLRGTADADAGEEDGEEEEEDGRKNIDDDAAAAYGGGASKSQKKKDGGGGKNSSWSLGPRVKALQRVIVETISEQQRDTAAAAVVDDNDDDDELVDEDEETEKKDKTLQKQVSDTIHTFLIDTFTAKGMETYLLHSFVSEGDGGDVVVGGGGGGSGDTNILQSLTYFDIRSLLNQMEQIPNIDKSKTLFGKYKSSYLSKWETILYQYRQNNVHISHSIRLLTLGYQYEIPALKENIATKNKKLVSVETRITELEGRYNDVCIKFDTMCTELGIDGIEDMDVSINRVVRIELPGLCETIENELMQEVGLREAVEYYEQFVSFVTLSTRRKRKKDSSSKEKKEEEEEERIVLVKTLKRFLLSGSSSSSAATNAAAVITRSDDGPSSDTVAAVPMLRTEEEDNALNTEQPTTSSSQPITSGKKEEEEKGDDDDGTDEIDWGLDDNGDSEPPPNDVDNAPSNNNNDTDDNNNNGMDWDIEITDAGKVDDYDNCGGQGVVGGNVIQEQQPQPTTSTTSFFSLASKSVRYDLLSDLTELKSFLQTRLLEQLNNNNTSSSSSLGNDKGGNNGTIPIKTELEIESYIHTIHSILKRLTTGKFQTLTLLSTNIQYRNKIVSNLNTTLDGVTKTQSKIDDMIYKKENLLQQISELKETLNLYEGRVDMLKFDLEVEVKDLLLLGSGKKKPTVVRIVV